MLVREPTATNREKKQLRSNSRTATNKEIDSQIDVSVQTIIWYW